jgi:hypothetical protein
MSSGIDVYAVSIERLNQLAGSRDPDLVGAVIEQQHDFLESIDALDEEGQMSCAHALAEVVNGEISGEMPGYLYGYAVKALCAHVGKELPGISPIARGSEWIEEIDGLLTSRQIPLQLSTLVYGGSPLEIPQRDDYPFIGSWAAEEIPAALEAFRALDTAALDPEMAETLVQMRTWLEAAAATPGTSLVGFLY